MKLTVGAAQPALSRTSASTREPIRIGLVQQRWYEDPAEHEATLADGIATAAKAGAQMVFLQELTLNRYPGDSKPYGYPDRNAEPLIGGPTHRFAARMANEHGILIHASLFELTGSQDHRGLNTAIVVDRRGAIMARTPKLHIPVTAGYYEDKYFAHGPNNDDPYPVYNLDLGLNQTANFGFPTCWDEWFPEVSRNYGLRGAEVLAYPTAIGSEPDFPRFDTEPLWRQSIIGQAITNGLFMVVPNRWGNEGTLNFYGSSFICDPYGRILARAGREEDEVLVADLDLDQRRDWLTLFPFYATRRPDTYGKLLDPIVNPRAENGEGIYGGIAGVDG